MATIFKNPNLPDYFVAAEGVRRGTPLDQVRSFVPEYENSKVIYFPNLKLDIDFEFWANVPSDQFPSMKKLVCRVDNEQQADLIERSLKKANGPPELNEPLRKNMRTLFEQVMPFYYRIFGGYRFSEKRAIWRLNTTLNENMHIDTYKEEYPDHFSRMFINLDNQPRIWMTSYTADEIQKRFGPKVARKKVETITDNRYWRELTIAAFGGLERWYDNEPRHVIYFDPGDIWIVDSRLVSHQIFYGRRAISIDFSVERASMLDSSKHYLALAKKYRSDALASAF